MILGFDLLALAWLSGAAKLLLAAIESMGVKSMEIKSMAIKATMR